MNGRTRMLPYNLVDGVYPHYALFIRWYEQAVTDNEKTFNRLQEALRRDVEQRFAVLNSRFQIALRPPRYPRVTTSCAVAKAVAILHKMVPQVRQGRYLAKQRRDSLLLLLRRRRTLIFLWVSLVALPAGVVHPVVGGGEVHLAHAFQLLARQAETS